jgi:hypothetical protein
MQPPSGPEPQHCPFMHVKVGGQTSPLGPQPLGGGKQLFLTQHWPFMHVEGEGQAAPEPQPGGFGTQVFITQAEPAGQGVPLEQPCIAVHIPFWQLAPGGQVGQGAMHAPETHEEPAGQGAPEVQL